MSGLEIVGAIASVSQLAGTVFAISKQLYEIADALSNAPSDIEDLAQDLQIFHQQLLLHAKLVNAENARYSNQIIRLTVKIIGRCADICVKIDNILKKLRSGSVWAKVKWLYKEKQIARLLKRLFDLKLSLMDVSAHLLSAKTDYVLDALKITRPSIFESSEDKEQSRETIADIERITQKLTSMKVGGDLSQGKTNTSRSVSVPTNTRTKYSVKSTPKSLGWTKVETELNHYKFVVPDVDEPYFALLPKSPVSLHNPEIVFLDKYQGPLEDIYPCMYPGCCNGSHSFFQDVDLKRHYRISHAGICNAGDPVAVPGSASPPAGEVRGFEAITSHHSVLTSPSSISPSVRSASRSIIRSRNSITLLAPKPTKLTQHVLQSMQSFHSAVSRQPSPAQEGEDQRTLYMTMESKNAVVPSVDNQPQDTGYEHWRRDMIDVAIKYFQMPSEAAATWASTLQAPIIGSNASFSQVPSPNIAQNEYIVGANLMADKRGASRPSKVPSSTGLLAQYSSGNTIQGKRLFDSRSVRPSRNNEYFLSKDGIDREVITADIRRYLGDDALVRPGTYEDPYTRQRQQGYLITAYRNLTNAMIADLKADSARWAIEKRELGIPSRGHPKAFPSESSFHIRQYPGATGYPKTSSGSPGANPNSTRSLSIENRMLASNSYSAMPFSRPGGYAVQDNYHIVGAYTTGKENSYHGRARTNTQLPSSSCAAQAAILSSYSRFSQLWWLAYLQIHDRDQSISNVLLNKYQSVVAPPRMHSAISTDPALVEQKAASLQAENLLAVLTLSDDISSSVGDLDSGKQPDEEVLNSVIIISEIIKIIRESFEFKIGAFVWILYCVALEEIVKFDQQNSTARSYHILPHMAEIATLIARYNIMENIYMGSTKMTLDPSLQTSLLQMSTYVLLYIHTIIKYHLSHVNTNEEDQVLREIERYMVEIEVADVNCRQFTMRIYDQALEVADYSSEEEDVEGEGEDYNSFHLQKKLRLS